MVAYLLYALAALYLGVLTSISPCPLATNIAAISYIGRTFSERSNGGPGRSRVGCSCCWAQGSHCSMSFSSTSMYTSG